MEGFKSKNGKFVFIASTKPDGCEGCDTCIYFEAEAQNAIDRGAKALSITMYSGDAGKTWDIDATEAWYECPTCRSRVEDYHSFCSDCGTNIEHLTDA